MPKIPQYEYLSPEAGALRRRDGTRPWEVHPCEVDSFGWPPHASHTETFIRHLSEVRKVRDEIERQG